MEPRLKKTVLFWMRLLNFSVSAKSVESPNFSTQILLTKPETNEFNQILEYVWQKRTLTTKSVKLAKEGRWQLLLKLNDGADTGFYKFEIEAK